MHRNPLPLFSLSLIMFKTNAVKIMIGFDRYSFCLNSFIDDKILIFILSIGWMILSLYQLYPYRFIYFIFYIFLCNFLFSHYLMLHILIYIFLLKIWLKIFLWFLWYTILRFLWYTILNSFFFYLIWYIKYD